MSDHYRSTANSAADGCGCMLIAAIVGFVALMATVAYLVMEQMV
jgi:hypothetical protein